MHIISQFTSPILPSHGQPGDYVLIYSGNYTASAYALFQGAEEGVVTSTGLSFVSTWVGVIPYE